MAEEDFSTFELQRTLLRKNILLVDGKVDEDMLLYMQRALGILVSNGSPDIQLLFTSGGGNVDLGLHIYDMLRLYPGKKTGTVLTHAKSMAAVILQACENRQCARHGVVMIHHINTNRMSLDTLRNKELLEERIRDMEESQESLYKILSDRCKKTREEIVTACEEGNNFTAEEARVFGLVDVVI